MGWQGIGAKVLCIPPLAGLTSLAGQGKPCPYDKRISITMRAFFDVVEDSHPPSSRISVTSSFVKTSTFVPYGQTSSFVETSADESADESADGPRLWRYSLC